MDQSVRANFGSVVRAGESYYGKQGLDYMPGVSAQSVVSQAIWLGNASSTRRTKAHLHEDHETALYLISGDEVELWTGEQLEHREVTRAGDYIYITAEVPHVAVNRTETPAAFVAAQTDLNEQESVVMRPNLETKKVP